MYACCNIEDDMMLGWNSNIPFPPLKHKTLSSFVAPLQSIKWRFNIRKFRYSSKGSIVRFKSFIPVRIFICDKLRHILQLRWSTGSGLAFGTQIRGFGFFRAKKILSRPSFGGEVKPSVPCRRFSACKRSLKKVWKSLLSAKFVGHLSLLRSLASLWRETYLAVRVGTSED